MSSSPRGSRRILILQGDVDGNLGDLGILQSTCHGIRELAPGTEIAVVANRQGLLGANDNLRIIPRGLWGLPALCAAARRSDTVLCGGGGLFQDDDSLVKMPYWGMRVLLARLLCRRVLGYSLGVGPLASRTGRLFARVAFAAMERVSVRDPLARRVAQPLTSRHVEIVPDPALLLPPVPEDEARAWLEGQGVPSDGRPLVGVAARRWFPPRRRLVPNKIASRFRPGRPGLDPGSTRLAGLLARVLDEIGREQNARIVFLPTYTVSHEGDDRVCRETMSRMRHEDTHLAYVTDPAMYKGVASCLSVLLGGRMHPTIFAASVGTPVVGLAYNPKFFGFFELLGLRNQVLDVLEFVRDERVDDLSARLHEALAEPAGVSREVPGLRERIRAFHRFVLEGGP